MSTRISATELSRSLSDVLNRVRYRGGTFVVERNGEAVATLEPTGARPRTTWRELADRLRDFSLGEDAESFASDLEAIQRDQPVVPSSQWPS